MSQHDYDIANSPGATFRADLNLALAAALSNNSGATAPATTTPFMLWADTANDLLKIRNAANDGWLSICYLSTGAPVNLPPPVVLPVFRGALISNPSANTPAGADITSWQTEIYDTDALHDVVTNPERLTVPVGVTLIRLSFNVVGYLSSLGAYIYKNGADISPPMVAHVSGGDVNARNLHLTTPPLAVVAGDYFTVRVTTGTIGAGTAAWFAMEIIE